MKTKLYLLSISLCIFGYTTTGSAGLCTTGQHVGNPHCHGQTSLTGTSSPLVQTGIGTTGQVTDTATKNPTTGSIVPDHHTGQLQPVTGSYQPGPSGYAPVKTVTGTVKPGPSGYGAVPSPTPQIVPQQTPKPVANAPQAVPGKVPPMTVTGTYPPGPSGYAPVPQPRPQPVPHQVPQPVAAVPQAVPPKIPSQLPTTVMTGSYGPGSTGYAPVPTATYQPHQVPVVTVQGKYPSTTSGVPAVSPGGGGPVGVSHQIVIQNNGQPRPVTSGHHMAATPYVFEVIEPGIQNKEVAVYRSNDARQLSYADAIKQDHTGFFLIDIGIRDPDYIK